MVIDLNETFEYKRKALMKKYDISFEFLNNEYGLRQCPYDRKNVSKEKTLDYFCKEIRRLYNNIEILKQSNEDKYLTDTIEERFNSVLPKWKQQVDDIEKFVYDYYKRFILINGEINEPAKS
jgi:hypothetical protein